MNNGRAAIGRVLRLPLRAIPKNSVLLVVSGPLMGKRWVARSSVHSCWLGWYERRKAVAFRNAIEKGAVVWDIGANVGYYSLIAANAARAGKVFSFEPLPSNVASIRRHLELNHVGNVTVLEVAVTDHEGEGLFERAESNAMGRLQDTGDLRVRLVSIDGMVGRGEAEVPSVIKMDVEGAEFGALRGGIEMLKAHRPVILLATHGVAVHEACCDLLLGLDYELQPLEDVALDQCSELIARPGRPVS